jgi:hypothetical protein
MLPPAAKQEAVTEGGDTEDGTEAELAEPPPPSYKETLADDV